MNIRILYALLFLIPSLVFGAGLSLNEDRTKYVGPHYLVKINEDQLEEVTVAGTLTLSRAQWQEVRQKNPATPEYFKLWEQNSHSPRVDPAHFGC
jgi:hypothetical protein